LQVADDEAGKQHEAQLAARRLDDWRIEVPKEGYDDDTGRGDADDGEHGRHDGERTVPAHVLLGKSEAAAAIFGRPPAARARPASVLVLDVGARVARCANPAASVALLDSLDVSDVTWQAALRQRDVICTCIQGE